MVVGWIERFFEAWSRIIQAAERTLVDNIAATVPWLAPMAPAYMAYANTIEAFRWPAWVALTVALAVEGLGLSAISTAFRLWEWNDTKRVSEQAAPLGAALGAAGMYVLVVMVVNVILDGGGFWEKTAKAILSLLSVVAGVVLALRSQHARRLAEREEARRERREARTARLRQDGGKSAEFSGKLPEFSENGNGRDWRTLTHEERLQVAACRTTRDVMAAWGVPERTARNWLVRARAEFGVVGEVARFAQENSEQGSVSVKSGQYSVR
jgi:hypothetical protein